MRQDLPRVSLAQPAIGRPWGLAPRSNTTPESLDLQQMFAEVRDAGGTHAVLETSSHALAMDRLWGCHFAVAIFTNLTRDHLDYHKTFEDYFAAKRALFEGTGAGVRRCGRDQRRRSVRARSWKALRSAR